MKINLFSIAAPQIFKDLEKKTGEKVNTLKITAYRPEDKFSMSIINEAGQYIQQDSGKLSDPANKNFIEAIEMQIKISVPEVKEVEACFIAIERKQPKGYGINVDVYYIDKQGNKLNNSITL